MSEPFIYEGMESAMESVPPEGYAAVVGDERREQVRELSEDFIDRAFERFSGPAEPEPVEEPEPEGPTEEQLAEQAAWAAGRRDETLAGREAQRVLSELAADERIQELAEEEKEEFYDRALDLIYDADAQTGIEIAKQVAEQLPERWDEFLEDWQSANPLGPYLFQQQQVAEQNERARAVYAQQLREEQEAAHRETIAALEGALKGLSRDLKSPTNLVDLSADAAGIVSQMLEHSPPQSPEEARQLVQLARRGTREIADARETARLLIGIDEAINLQGVRDGYHDDGTRYEPFDRRRGLARLEAEHIRPERLLAAPVPDVLDRGLAFFDAELERREAMESEWEDSPTLRAAHAEKQAERRRRNGGH